jgi:hypothetical protein
MARDIYNRLDTIIIFIQEISEDRVRLETDTVTAHGSRTETIDLISVCEH